MSATRPIDAIRVTGRELGAKVIGEGANLGMTQKARNRVRAEWRPLQIPMPSTIRPAVKFLRRRGQHQDSRSLPPLRRDGLTREKRNSAAPQDMTGRTFARLVAGQQLTSRRSPFRWRPTGVPADLGHQERLHGGAGTARSARTATSKNCLPRRIWVERQKDGKGLTRPGDRGRAARLCKDRAIRRSRWRATWPDDPLAGKET